MYKVDGESIDHLFIHCPMAKELWDTILSLWGVLGYVKASARAD
jgi:hypothetical protein